MTAFGKGGERAIVTITGLYGNTMFSLYVPQKAIPGNIAGIFLAVTPRLNKTNFQPGETMADFIAAVNPLTRCRLLTQEDVNYSLSRTDLHYVLTWTNYTYEVSVYRVERGIQHSLPLFAGKLHEFTEWATTLTGLEDIVQKVVQFNYQGGSNPGGQRTVRVEKVSRVGNIVHIEGLDLGVSDLKDGYRRYTSDKISGEISVLN